MLETPEIHLARQPDADALLGRSPLAAPVGMLLDQQVPMEWAFSGPYTIASRLGADDPDAHEIAARDPEEFAALLSENATAKAAKAAKERKSPGN